MLTYNVMSQKAINYIANGVKGALFLLPVLTLLVSDHLFFPFITTKNFFFRFSVEILFFFWVLLMVFDKKYRPRKSPVLLALAGTLFILFLATFFGENIYRSFWSNYERMEGLIGHIHLFAYFLILTSLLRTKKSWKIFFGSMVLVSLIVSVYAFLQFSGGAEIHQSATRLDATLGNATYLAVFIIFHLFLISLLALWFKNKWLRISLAILFALETIVMFFTATRGAILGFLGGLFVMGVLISILGKNKKLRYAFMGLVVGCLVIVSLFVLFKDTNFVKQNYVLSRFAGISFSEQTVESRFTIWKMSFEGFQEHPVLGWGPENYNLVFNKYYVPKLWRQEPWFDRSHNVLFDWLITAGILGLLSYLFIYASSLYVVWKGYKKKTMGILEASAVTALFGAYLFHNLFVFDNLTSYFAFFSVLGYLHFCWVSNKEEKEEKESIRRDLPFSSYILITFVFIATVISLVFVNVKPLLANTKIIETLFLIRASQPPQQALEKFDEVFGYNSFGSGEAREQLIGYANKLVSVQGVSEEVKIQVINKSIEEAQKQVESSPNDIRYLLTLSSMYSRVGKFQEAMDVINRTLEISPNKQQLYFIKADIYLLQGKNKEAADTMEIAYKLDTRYPEAARNTAMLFILDGREAEAEEILLGTFSKKIIADSQLATVYARVGNYEKVRDIWLEFIKEKPEVAQYHVNLSATYMYLGDQEISIKELERAVELNPDFKEQADYLINEIKAGRNPQSQ